MIMMKNKKLITGILALAIIILSVVGCSYFEKQESETGFEWFQAGNTIPITQPE
ncbi:unnamed protein product, partial [marine sediment metagenome]